MKFILDGKEYSYIEAMNILLKDQPKTNEACWKAHMYLMTDHRYMQYELAQKELDKSIKKDNDNLT